MAQKKCRFVKICYSDNLGCRFFKVNIEGCSFVGGRESDAAAGTLDDMFRNRESQTVAVALRREIRPEDLLLYIRGNTGAVVGYRNLHLFLRIERVERHNDIAVFLKQQEH